MSGYETAKRLTLWFRQWRAPLRRFLMEQGIVPAAEVSDVAQEVFLRLLRYDRAELIEYPQAYLFKMAANVANEWALRARRRHPHESQWLDGLLAKDRPEADIAQAQAQAEIERALYSLSPRQRAVLKMQFTEGLGREEIARRLGSTPRIVKRELMKSYERLRTELDPELLRVISYGRE
jgi:RNA polymerase sigma factor (sigma-70 family)